jgi:hypothetical protein
MIYGRAMAQAVGRRPPSVEDWVRFRVSTRGVCGGQTDTGVGSPRLFRSSPVNYIPSALNYWEKNNNNNHHHHNRKVEQEALRLRCFRSVCCGVLLHKKLKSW